MSDYLQNLYMDAYNQGKKDAEGLRVDELKEILLSVKGIEESKSKSIMEAVMAALDRKNEKRES